MAFITLNRENFYHNLNQIALKTGSVDKIAIVLKDNAYGHGLRLMAQLASDFGIRHAVVRDHLEAAEVNSLFETVLILGGEVLSLDRCSYAINSLEEIAAIPAGTKVELKVDTGMHRNGIAMDEVDEALSLIRKYDLNLTGLMTHYHSADLLGSELFWQQKQFEIVCQTVREVGFSDLRIHSHNSAAILRSKHFDEDLVRVGIAAYGYNELPSPFDNVVLKPVLKLHARKVSSRSLKQGERVGYGGTFTAPKEMRISTYDLGYGDGWCRGDSDHPYITAEGLPILGRVSMDFVALETDKDEVCIMSDAQEAAKQFGTISYEMTTALSPNIERIVIQGIHI
ncbi:MAG: alanine racemase [Campylobacterota bacterium]|nr:alanine racemase [Campylobacterota bacterium]